MTAMNQDFEGKVARFADALNDDSAPCTRDRREESGWSFEGRNVRGSEVDFEAAQGCPHGPHSGAERNSTGASVLIVDAQGRVEKRQVKLGVESSDRVEVVDGLDNDRVIVGNRSEFREGRR
jgi:hypothetical protein